MVFCRRTRSSWKWNSKTSKELTFWHFYLAGVGNTTRPTIDVYCVRCLSIIYSGNNFLKETTQMDNDIIYILFQRVLFLNISHMTSLRVALEESHWTQQNVDGKQKQKHWSYSALCMSLARKKINNINFNRRTLKVHYTVWIEVEQRLRGYWIKNQDFKKEK